MLEVERLCERVVFIAGGHIVADGTPDEVAAMFGHGDLESVFLQLAGTDMEPRMRRRMSWLRIMTVVRRHWYVLWRSPNRWFDIAVWPLFDVLLFGSLGAFVAQENDASRAAAPYLLAGIMLFHVLFQCQIAVTTGFMEETWSRNLLNIMTTPITRRSSTPRGSGASTRS